MTTIKSPCEEYAGANKKILKVALASETFYIAAYRKVEAGQYTATGNELLDGGYCMDYSDGRPWIVMAKKGSP